MPDEKNNTASNHENQFCAEDIRVLSAVENYQPVRSKEISNSTKINLDDVLDSLKRLEKIGLIVSQQPKETQPKNTVPKWVSLESAEEASRIFKMIVSRKVKTEKNAAKALKFVNPVKGSTASDIRRRIGASKNETLDALRLMQSQGHVQEVFTHKYRKGVPIFRYYAVKKDDQ